MQRDFEIRFQSGVLVKICPKLSPLSIVLRVPYPVVPRYNRKATHMYRGVSGIATRNWRQNVKVTYFLVGSKRTSAASRAAVRSRVASVSAMAMARGETWPDENVNSVLFGSIGKPAGGPRVILVGLPGLGTCFFMAATGTRR